MIFRCLMLCSVALSFCTVAAAEDVRVEGGGASTSAYFSPFKENFEEVTGDSLIIKKTTSVEGLIALEKGLADIATGSAPLEGLIRQAAEKGVKIDPATLKATVVGKNRTLVIVHRSNMVANLSKEQLKGIFTGQINNWKEVGGEDLGITVVWASKTMSQNALFSQEILDGAQVTSKATSVTTYDDIRKFVMKNPGAVGIDAEGFKTGGLRVPHTPPLSSDMLVITKGEPTGKVKKVLDFIEAEELSDVGHEEMKK